MIIQNLFNKGTTTSECSDQRKYLKLSVYTLEPYSYLSKENGKPSGVDIDLMDMVKQKLDLHSVALTMETKAPIMLDKVNGGFFCLNTVF